MARPSVSSKDIHSMDMGLASTGLVRPSDVQVDPRMSQGLKTFFPHLDALFGKLIPGQVIAVAGVPGSGKTTFFMGLLSLLANGLPDGEFTDTELEGIDHEPKTCAYISAEERIDALKEKSDRFGIDNIYLANESTVEDIAQLIRENDLDVVVVDSLHALNSDLVSGESKTIKYAGNVLTKVAKDTNTIVIVICHSTAAGKIKGGSKFPHQCDTEMFIAKLNEDDRLVSTLKNRMGPTGSVGLKMGAAGYDFSTSLVLGEDGKVSVNDDIKEAILDQIRLADEDGLDLKELASLCEDEGIDLGKAELILKELVVKGDLVREGTRRHNFKWYAG